MKKYLLIFLLMGIVNSCSGDTKEKYFIEADSTRLPVFANKFYPADPVLLKKTIQTFLDGAQATNKVNPLAIIVPHAGYIFSGQIAADAYNQVKNNRYDLVIILGTNHTTAGFSKYGIYPKGEFVTPIGAVKIDEKFAEQLIKEDSDIVSNLSAHAKEHSIEVQIPFIKYLFPDALILPVIVGESDSEMCTKFSKTISKLLQDKKALIVASSDLSHYPKFDNAIITDNNTLNAIASLNSSKIKSEMSRSMNQGIAELVTCACGEAPILAAIAIAKELGGNKAEIISYSNSGYNSIGNVNRVVGYGSVVIGKGEPTQTKNADTLVTDQSYILTSSDKKVLIKYARNTLSQYFSTQTVPLPRNMNPKLKLKRGAFVTLKKNGELRGCIGHMSEDTPLCTVVGAMVLQAAFGDTRFSPLTQKEFAQVEIEISVLTPFRAVKNAEEIVMGRDGVLLKKGGKQAVYLPQVADETGWSKEMFLDQLCYKAGLEHGDWKDSQLFKFQADVFSESDFH